MSMESDEYFATTPPPAHIQDVEERVRKFVTFHHTAGHRVVLVTSGGTTVPLENQTVRFLDNFSAGTRGATSAEYFLEAGYAVIFLHRQFSLQPYSRHYSHSKNCFLDYMQLREDGSVQVDETWSEKMKVVLAKYQKAKRDNQLLMIDYVTVRDYLFLLRSITQILSVIGRKAMYYLAAAVSDFYIPMSKMVEHKIQSDDGNLALQLDKVPKIIKPLVKEWAPSAFVVSFKLETDPSLLLKKAHASLDRYGHQIVIGNILNTRKRQVVFCTTTEATEINLSDEELHSGVEIESKIIPELVSRHNGWIESSETK
ncbi:hypothetical protein HK102_001902 [Quaeritorhiza haematococci]|nr:hypothetical protein HK102_001902 [Quaeritorhiza haematococci]